MSNIDTAEKKLEMQIEKHQLAFQELVIKTDRLNEQVENLLNELSISSEQLTAFIENKNNFNEENWQTIVEERQKFDEKLKRELSNIHNPLKNKKTYSQRVVSQHWLYVK